VYEGEAWLHALFITILQVHVRGKVPDIRR